MVCPNCGMENTEDATVCVDCGTTLSRQPLRFWAKDFAIASLVLGILSLLIFPYLYGPMAIVAAVIALKKGGAGKLAVSGLILGAVALIAYIVTRILLGA